ncbi:MAG: DUF1461 domain-containing protein [Pseudomonadota bacterium]
MKQAIQRIAHFIFWPVFFIAHLLTFSILSWHLLAQIDFAYPLGYKLLDLQQHIQENAPENRFKHKFEYTTPQQHWDLFSQITSAIQHHGKGLVDISYTLPNGSSTPLMHQAEIIHLQDVANLIDVIYRIGILSAILWLALMITAYRKQISFPPVKKILTGFVVSIASISIIIVSLGATDIFYWLHTKIFPDGHQWFFYYEESLMTTLMKAPDIFAFIALLLISLLMTLWISSVWGINRVLTNRQGTGKQSIEKHSAKKITLKKSNKKISGKK